MGVVYRIPYSVYREYFGEDEISGIRLNLWITKFIRAWRSKQGWWVWVGLFLLFWLMALALRLLTKILTWMAVVAMRIAGVSIPSPNVPMLQMSVADASGLMLIWYIVFLLVLFAYYRTRFEQPYVLRDAINDVRSIELNFGKGKKPLDLNRFSMLASLRADGDLSFTERKIPGLRNRSAFYDAFTKLRKLSVAGQPLVDAQDRYLAWRFELIDSPLGESRTKAVESLLTILWEHYLDIEADRIEKRKSTKK